MIRTTQIKNPLIIKTSIRDNNCKDIFEPSDVSSTTPTILEESKGFDFFRALIFQLKTITLVMTNFVTIETFNIIALLPRL